ncbi:comEA [Mytilus coruscus]|uniref:ComEA n=1 Tax=Mytilus coruscus TaxID=42192 RepID=A0A6J8DGA9_MYTCO|nr:comEA [Mytilus coruscus]
MSKVVNINTASKEELTTIKDIGETRAKIIIAARTDKGKLTLEDLKLIEGLPKTMWDPLVAAGRIIFENTKEVDDSADQKKQIETLKTELVNQKQDAEQEIKKIQNNFNTWLLIATQEKTTIQHELKHQIKDLQDALEGEMEEKNEYAKLIEEIKQKYAMESSALQEFNQQEKENC